jgi:hypothetical protein
MECFGVKLNHKFEYLTVSFLMLGYQITTGLLFLYYLLVFESVVLSQLSYFFTVYLVLCYGMYSGLILVVTHRRIRSINKICDDNLENCSSQDIKEVGKTFIKYQETLKLINKCFGFFYMTRKLEFLFNSLLLSFNVYKIIVNGFTTALTIFLFSGCFHITASGFYILLIFIFSSWIEKDCNQFEVNFGLIRGSTNFYDCKGSISCGLFKIDWKLLFLMVTTNFSYLIILIQFVLAYKQNSSNVIV